MTATVAYGLEATQAYNVTEKEDGDIDSEDDEGHKVDLNAKTPAFDLQATQAYGVGVNDDEEEEDESESRKETLEEQAIQSTVSMDNRGDANQPTIAFGLESTQAYGAEETDDEESDDQGKGTAGGVQFLIMINESIMHLIWTCPSCILSCLFMRTSVLPLSAFFFFF